MQFGCWRFRLASLPTRRAHSSRSRAPNSLSDGTCHAILGQYRPVNQRDKVQLLFGPYRAAALRRGDRAFCLARDCDVVITSWTAARISWPRCRSLEKHGGSGVLLDEELARAVRHESATAIMYWWGVGHGTVRWWRRTLGVKRPDPEGTRRLLREVWDKAVVANRGRKLPADQVERRRKTAIALNLGRYLRPGRGPSWSAEELQMLGKLPDARIAALTGRAESAVRVQRSKLGIRSPRDRRFRKNRRQN
jgi:hypothetical protein